MKTVGLPNRLSFDIGPYFIILSSSHFSAVLARIARRRPRLWPMIGIPSEPGATLFDDSVLLISRSRTGIRKRKRASRIFMIKKAEEKGNWFWKYYWVFQWGFLKKVLPLCWSIAIRNIIAKRMVPIPVGIVKLPIKSYWNFILNWENLILVAWWLDIF